MHRLSEDSSQLIHVADEVAALRDGPGDSHRVHFLESHFPYHVCGYLAGDRDHGHRVHEGIGYSGHQVSGARARGRYHHPYPVRRPSISIRSHGRVLLVADQDVVDLQVAGEGVVEGEYRAAGVAEDRVNPLFDEGSPNDLRSGEDCSFVPREVFAG